MIRPKTLRERALRSQFHERHLQCDFARIFSGLLERVLEGLPFLRVALDRATHDKRKHLRLLPRTRMGASRAFWKISYFLSR